MKTNHLLARLALCAVLAAAAPALLAPSVSQAQSEKASAKEFIEMPSGSPTQTYRTGSFSKVQVGSALQVILRKGSKHSVAAYGPKELVDELQVKEESGKLSIHRKSDSQSRQTNSKDRVVLVIESPSVTEAGFSGATKALVQDFQGGNFSLKASGASSAQLHISCDKLTVNASGASQTQLLGKAGTLVADLSGASRLQAKELKVTDATIDASGASNATVHATGVLSVDASGASSIEYAGNPKEIKSETSGMSKVKKS